jgi:hypothetical protein
MGKYVGLLSVLLIVDHGYAPLKSSAWVGNLRPKIGLLSVATGDPDGRLGFETIDTFSEYSLLRTGQNGWIRVSSDGRQMWVKVEK